MLLQGAKKMSRARFFKVGLFIALFVILATGASAQVTISGGFALSSMEVKGFGESIDGDIGLGGNVYADYLLPIGVPLSLGFEIGFDTATIGDESEVTGIAVPLLLRAAYHFDLMANLDLYLVGKIGYILGSAESDIDSDSGYNGLGFGVDVGAAYYFNPRLGVFGEVGFDQYNGEKDDIKVIFSRFVTVGVSTKF
jgi:hypothetical protein